METKKCVGMYGHHFCVENGPYDEPILPLHEFSRDVTTPDGKQRICKMCQSEWHKRTNLKYNPRKNAISAIAYSMAGSHKIFYALPKEERQSIRDSATLEVENLDWLGFNPPTKLEEALPKIYKEIKRQPPKQEKIDYPPEGYVYVFRNRWHPEGVYKIGSTDNLESRRSAARTWGPYDCEYYLEVKDCKLVESMVHTKLRDYQIEAGDLGQEHFSVDLERATSIIKDVAFEVTCMHTACVA
jgi:hypothetical protein